MKNPLIICFISIISFAINAQEIKFGKVSKDELTQKQSAIDTSTGAEYLYLNKDIYFEIRPEGYNLITEVHKRIKLYKNRNEDLVNATERVYLYESGSDREELRNLKATTFNLINTGIVETELDKDQIFKEQVTDSRQKVSFTMPNAQAGSVLDIKYKIVSPFFYQVDELRFQFGIPVKNFRGRITVPGNMRFRKSPKGYFPPTIKEEKTYDYQMEMESNRYTYTAENVPGLKKEKWIDNIDNYKSAIVFDLVGIRFPSGKIKNFSTSWNAVAHSLSSHEDYKKGLKKDGVFKEDLDAYLKKIDDPVLKMNKVLEFAKSHISWNKQYGKYFDLGIRGAYKEMSGNVADVNLSLVAMLNHVGLEAVPIVLTTSNYMRPLFPTLNHLNYVVALVEIEDRAYYLDATDIYSEPNILPNRVYNHFGLMVDTPNKNWKRINLSTPPPSVKMDFLNLKLKEDGSIEGKVKQAKENHYAYSLRKKFFQSSKQEYLTQKEINLGEASIEDYKIENADGLGKVEESFIYKRNKAFTKIDDELIINPIFFGRYKTSPFKSEERNYPIDFFAPYNDKMVINLKIPEGYKVKSIPESVRLKFKTTIGSFRYFATNSGKYITINIEEAMNTTRLEREEYSDLKKYFNKIVELEARNIILIKEE